MGRPGYGEALKGNDSHGAEYTLKLLFADSRRMLNRLENQRALFENLLQTNNSEMVDREINKLDQMQSDFLEIYAQIRDLIETETEEYANLVEAVDREDTEVFKVKKVVSVWMIEQAEKLEALSGSSKGSRSSRNLIAPKNVTVLEEAEKGPVI